VTPQSIMRNDGRSGAVPIRFDMGPSADLAIKRILIDPVKTPANMQELGIVCCTFRMPP
jgi:hypothetical protein